MHKRLLKGKRGIIIGVANERSIAWACAKACAHQGATLAFNALPATKDRTEDLVAQEMPGSMVVPCDVASDTDIAAFVDVIGGEWDTVDFIIHSVAYSDRENLRDSFIGTTRDNFARTMDISVYSLVAVAREARDLLSDQASIITLTYYGGEKVVPHYNVMGVAKAALDMSVRYLAYDLGGRNVRVNAISAGPIKTLSAHAIGGFSTLRDINKASSPLQRNVTADEIAHTAVYLASDLASGVTGEVVHVDGGFNIMGITQLPEKEPS